VRVGFAGTPELAAAILEALLAAGFDVPLVLTQPDRPRGRGLRSEPSPVKRLAAARGLAVSGPATLRSGEALAPLLGIRLDVLAVAAYGLILPPEVLAWPRHGAINVHASLLPRWRGAAPIQRAILAGDAETGVSIMQMDAGLDTGAVLETVRVPLGPRATAASVESTLAREGATALIRVLRDLEVGNARRAVPQPDAGATYAAKVDKREAVIDWAASAAIVDRMVRAFDPAPGAATTLGAESVKLWRVEPSETTVPGVSAGTIVDVSSAGIVVACGKGMLRITTLQPAGSRRMDSAAFAAGRRSLRGMRFGASPQSPCRKPSTSPRES
jgi:methionyl-tRNA formyltransferase